MRVTRANFVRSIEGYIDNRHVSASDKDIEEQLRDAIARSLVRNPSWVMSEPTKTAIVRMALKRHHANQALYSHVMRGTI